MLRGLPEELSALHSHVLNTLSEVRTPSTRRLYALKIGSVCEIMPYAHIDTATCSVTEVLHFLWYILDSGSLPSTLKVYMAAIASFRSPLDGQSIDRHALVVSEEIKAFPAPACSPALGPWSGIKSAFTAITRAFSIR